MADNKWVLPVLVILVAILALNSFPAGQKLINNIIGGFATVPTEEEAVVTDRPFCEHDGITVTVGPTDKMFAPATSVSGVYHRLIIDGIDDGLKVDGSTKALTPGDKITVIYAENDTTYYASKVDITLPCAATLLTSKMDGGTHKLYQIDASTNLNIKTFDDDDGLLNNGSGGSATETLAAGDVVSMDGSLQGQFEDAFSPYGKIYVSLVYNTTAFDEVDFSAPGVADATPPTFRSTANITTGYAMKGWTIPGIISNEKVDFTVMLDADDTYAPSGNGCDVVMFFDDEDWYQDTDTGEMEFGPENNDDTNIGDTTDNTKSIEIT